MDARVECAADGIEVDSKLTSQTMVKGCLIGERPSGKGFEFHGGKNSWACCQSRFLQFSPSRLSEMASSILDINCLKGRSFRHDWQIQTFCYVLTLVQRKDEPAYCGIVWIPPSGRGFSRHGDLSVR